MILGDLNFGEIWFFFRYRSFPIAINVLLLFSWVYLIVVYFFNKRNISYLFLALATAILFFKEVILFFTVRHVIFDHGLNQVDIDFTGWIVLESVATFLFVVCLGNAYARLPFRKKFDYPKPEVFQKLRVWSGVNLGVLISLVLVVNIIEDFEQNSMSFILMVMSIMYLSYMAHSSNRIRVNYTAFGGGWLASSVHIVLLGYLGLTIVIYLGFTAMGVLYSADATISSFQISNQVREIPENYFHALKTVSYMLYVTFLLLVLTKNYQLASSLKKMQQYISKEVNSIGGRLRRQVLQYESPEMVIHKILRETSAHTQAEFAFFCFYKDKDQSLTYFDHISDSSKYQDEVKKLDLSGYLKNIVDRQRNILVDEIEELGPVFKEHFSFLDRPDTGGEDDDSINGIDFPCKVKSIISVPILSKNNLLYTIVLINKKEDYFDEWKEETSYGFVEALAEETRFLADYLIDYDSFIEKRNKAFHNRMGIEQSSIINLATQNIHEKLEKSPDFSLAWTSAYKHLPSKTMISMAPFQKKKILLMVADINGETSSRSYLAGVLQATFQQSTKDEKSIVGVMNRMNEALAISQPKNFVTATIYFYDESRRKFLFCNAAHTPILIFHVASNELISYDIDDPPLSVDTETSYRDANTDINEGDIIISYSEELFNLKDDKGEDYFNPAKVGNIIKHIENRDPQIIAEQLALECESMKLPLENQPVFLVGQVKSK